VVILSLGCRCFRPSVVYVNCPLIVLSISCSSVNYVNNPSHSFLMLKTVKGTVSKQMYTSISTGGYIMLKTVRGAVKIKYWWTSCVPTVVCVNIPFPVLCIKCPSIVYVNIPSHSFEHKVTISTLC
jgi:hypothetical protein